MSAARWGLFSATLGCGMAAVTTIAAYIIVQQRVCPKPPCDKVMNELKNDFIIIGASVTALFMILCFVAPFCLLPSRPAVDVERNTPARAMP